MLEKEIQKAIIEYLQIYENLGKLYFFRSGSGAIPTKQGGYFKTGKVGCPDISCLHKGKYYGFEVKNEKGIQSENQKIAEKNIVRAGGVYEIVRSVGDVERVLDL